MPVKLSPFPQNRTTPTYDASVVVGRLKQEEAVTLIRSELKRMGLSDKISRYVYKKYYMQSNDLACDLGLESVCR